MESLSASGLPSSPLVESSFSTHMPPAPFPISQPNSVRLPRHWLGVPLAVHGFAWMTILVLVAILAGVTHAYRNQNVWQHWTASRSLEKPGYSERIYRNEVFRTRANTWSNLAYVMVGCYALALAYQDRRRQPDGLANYLTQTPAFSETFGLACCFLGFSSGICHASLTRWGQQLDVASMYAPLLALIAISAGRWIRRVKGPAVASSMLVWLPLVCLVVITTYLLYLYKWSMSSSVVLKTLILTATSLGLLDLAVAHRRLKWRWLVAGVVTVLAAWACRQLDVAGKFSGPDAWFQGHALWHVLTAAALACGYAFCRSESAAD